MREILFRAKRIDNGDWVEGIPSYGISDKITRIKHWKGLERKRFGKTFGVYTEHEIDPETRCQYIGQTDKNGNKIWENDICIIHSSNIDEEDGYFTVEWDDDSARYVLNGRGLTVDFDNIYWYEIEVIGNIFDNPELLEED